MLTKYIVFTATYILLGFNVYAQCTTPWANWTKAKTGTNYTWALDDGSVINANFDSDVSAEDIENAITTALSTWLTAIHNGSTNYNIITVTKATSYASANLQIKFSSTPNDEGCGYNSSTTSIDFAEEPKNGQWTLGYTSNNYKFKTILMHELGHWFGAIHTGLNSSSIMRNNACSPSFVPIALYDCDIVTIKELYNPTYNVKVVNNFSGYGGGKVKVDGIEYDNIPADGKVFDTWRKNTFPHTLEAQTQTFVDSQNGKTYNRLFSTWTNVVAEEDYSNNPISILPEITTYQANYLKEFNITLPSSPLYVESNSGGNHTISGVPTTSTTIRQFQSEQIQANPQGSGWILLDWKDDDEHLRNGNPLTLTPTDHVSGLTARFKQYFKSNSTNALSNNGQRKLIRDPNGNYHLVYVSAGKIFYSSKTGENGSWSNEVYLSNEFESEEFTYRNPTIDLYYESSSTTWKPIVVWEARLSDNSGYYLFARRIS